MKLSKDDFNWAASEDLVSTDQAELLWPAFERRHSTRSKFDLDHVAYYFGALIVIVAMGWFMTRVWEEFGGCGISLIASGYAICFLLAGRWLWHKPHLKVAGGLLFTVAVCMVPVAIYGLERLTGIWSEGTSGAFEKCHTCWFLIEGGTVGAGLMLPSVLLKRRVFIVFGSVGVFWYLSYLAYRVFKDSMLLPLALSLLGVVIIYLGITYQRNRERIERTIPGHLPGGLKRLQTREGHRM